MRSLRMLTGLAAVALLGGCGGGGGDGASGADTGSPVFMGSCTEPPEGARGSYGCSEMWQMPVEGLDLPALFRSVCDAAGTNTYATGHCPGGYIGCCTRAETDTEELKTVRECWYEVDDPDGLLPTMCANTGGVWE